MAEPKNYFYDNHGAQYDHGQLTNNRGKKLFFQQWVHPATEAKAIVLLIHGYAHHGPVVDVETDSDKQLVEALLEHKISVFSFDQENHGRSEGTRALCTNFDHFLQNIEEFYEHIKKTYSADLKVFLYGESMGGAEAILLSQRHPEWFAGLILLAPMCKIAEEVKPPSWQIPILRKLSKWFPEWAMIDSKVVEKCFKLPECLERAKQDPLAYQGKLRLGTANTLFEATLRIEATLDEVSAPFLVLHGSADIVTSPLISEELYNRASSKDKVFKKYNDMWHALRSEPESHLVISDIVEWLGARA